MTVYVQRDFDELVAEVRREPGMEDFNEFVIRMALLSGSLAQIVVAAKTQGQMTSYVLHAAATGCQIIDEAVKYIGLKPDRLKVLYETCDTVMARAIDAATAELDALNGAKLAAQES